MLQKPTGEESQRHEVMVAVGQGEKSEVAPGIWFERLVGVHNSARGLTTGIATVSPVSSGDFTLVDHVALSVLAGRLTLTVDDQTSQLGEFDCYYAPPQSGLSIVNSDPAIDAIFHVAMAAPSDTRPSDEWRPHLHRHAAATSYELTAGTRFQDYFNRSLGCPAMSGGYGVFDPGTRLPCHMHDFDESITIIAGTATCVVEGRRYSLSDNATALVPRGRCHYFMNEGNVPMAMIWVYAGGIPERMVLDEECCARDPWA
jgi:mannose-6-phosphate isomerase-like protein (cupin superfamily)